ncbi:stage II sporulation protein E [Paenibacillus ginsengarvi]|uniref:Stage II sporulation protein E n=1 Tax=Paenibacillus ginsengarvi TaxID=400777 RepID=A0A3B0B1M9_9BACL|nr:stage II sporulation protein E [Paenibacillus ginsengarvi]RKN65756.1 stage II sporulation protein E [Paenibacillus ginsengarvi]
MMKWNVLDFKSSPLSGKLDKSKDGGKRTFLENRFIQSMIARKWAFLLVVMAFLLGRAMILEQLTPFAIAYFAVVYFVRKDLIRWIGLSIIAGSLLAFEIKTGYIVTEMLVFLLVQKGLEKYGRSELAYAPIIVFTSAFAVQLFGTIVTSELTWYSLMLTAVEAALSFVLTLIFIQAIPVFTLTRKNYALKNEEIICLIILLGSVMTGTVGWIIQSVSLEHVLSRYLILLFAFVGGAPLGASVGVITGLVLSLADVGAIYQMSLLAFSGMLAGLLKEANRMAVAFGMLLGSSILSIYIGSQAEVMSSTWESVAAVILFMLTPRAFVQTIAKYVPGTRENMKSQHDYAKRVRDITATRVEQFSEVFRQLSSSFSQLSEVDESKAKEEAVGHFMNSVAGRACSTCWKRHQCWDDKFYQTYRYMSDMMTAIDERETMTKKDIAPEWKQICVRTDQVLGVMKQQYALFKHDLHWKRQIQDSRQLVAEQLSGVSQVMQDLAKEIKREGHELFLQEEQIRSALEDLGLSIHSIDIISLDEGNVEIEIIHQYTRGFDECRKIIAPLLSDILGENIAVRSEEISSRGDGFATVLFCSAKEFEVETGVAGAAKGGDLLSGDSFSTVELGNGKFAVAISDGMGNGERARAESSAALSILQQLLQSGMDEKLAIKSVNSVLMLRSSDEMFATVDVALIDQYSAQTTFMKIGSTPSYIKRETEVIQVTANNLPIGILQDIDVDLISMQLLPGDTLIMMTDGIFDAPGPAVNKEMYIKRIIQEIDETDPQLFADCMLDTIVRYNGDIMDDMTVVVARIQKYKPEWATFRWQGMTHFERPRTVS